MVLTMITWVITDLSASLIAKTGYRGGVDIQGDSVDNSSLVCTPAINLVHQLGTLIGRSESLAKATESFLLRDLRSIANMSDHLISM